MKRALLPLNALRAFDAAARHESFKKGAEELAVTPAAVSQQIRSLEEYLGVPLFKRQKNRLSLTSTARQALPVLRDAFRRFEEVVEILQHVEEDRVLRLSAPPAFASKWLIPRLGEFYDVSGDVVVHVCAQESTPDFTGDMDIAIRSNSDGIADCHVEEFMREPLAPVCAPSLIPEPLGNTAALLDLPLIHADDAVGGVVTGSWQAWLSGIGINMTSGERRDLHVGQAHLAIDAALAGRGVALIPRGLVAGDLHAGRLIRPVSCKGSPEVSYFIIFPTPKLEEFKVQTFVGWIRDAANER